MEKVHARYLTFYVTNDEQNQLKPYCVDLSQLVLKNGDNQAVIQSTERLLTVLRRVCENEAFDEKLADCKCQSETPASEFVYTD